jgi:hypothetical protein
VTISPLRRRVVVALAVIVPLGFALKFYDGPGRWYLNNWGASFAYEWFFIALALLVAGRAIPLGRIATGVCVATCALEFLQLWTPGWLEAVRATFVGRSLLGNAFSWRDLPAYPVGCLLGWWLLGRWVRDSGPSDAL